MRNVTAKDLYYVALVMLFMLPLFWFKESGEKWAAILVAAIPVVGVIYWLNIPSEKRVEAEQISNEELDKSIFGRAWKYFMWLIYLLVAVLLIRLVIGWATNA